MRAPGDRGGDLVRWPRRIGRIGLIQYEGTQTRPSCFQLEPVMSDLAPPIALETYRQQFPALNNKLYFNYGGQGPLSKAALDAILESYTLMQQHGPFSKKALESVTAQIGLTHLAIAQELGVSANTITLTESVTAGCNIALWGLPWQKGDRLLITDCEHPGIVAAVRELSRRFGLEIDICPVQGTLNEGDAVGAIAERIQRDTRLVVLSHILWNTGQVLPLAEIIAACRRQNPDVLLLVDAAQSVGVLPLNLAELDADFYAFTGHKWLCGPDGVGGLYIRPALHDRLQPTFIGWRGICVDASGCPTGWKQDGTKFEMATSAFPLYRGLQVAIEAHRQWGSPAQRYQRIYSLSQRLWSHLQDIPSLRTLRTAPPEAGLVSFQVEGQSHKEWVQVLENWQIMMRLIADPNCIRVCLHYLTLEAEVDTLAEKLRQMVQSKV
ncbi:aminotransferase class V-fold PLP-dependent enzyme [Altericista sp. CCNU0014]|uniref:aminotransferase class V-fold PLP-dependent enzyme n=1 Tax=Altericista sp. CCNU0014 TaxID=3082949 RepID=UPI00384ED2DC